MPDFPKPFPYWTDLGSFLEEFPFLRFDIHKYSRSRAFSASIEAERLAFVETLDHPSVTIDKAVLTADQVAAAKKLPIYAPNVAASQKLSEWPRLSKTDLRSCVDPFELSSDDEGIWHGKTSGSSGRPLSIGYSDAFFFSGMHLDIFKIAYRYGLRSPAQSQVAWVSISDDMDKLSEVILHPEVVDSFGVQLRVDLRDTDCHINLASLLARMRPDIIACKPQLLRIISEHLPKGLAESGARLIISSGAHLDSATRTQVSTAFGAPVVNAYATSELGLVASECSQGTMHVDPGVFVEDDTVDQAKQLIVTNLRNICMPMIRYLSGDEASVTSGAKCRCGSDAATITGLVGRTMPLYRLPSGRLLSPSIFMNIFRNVPLLHEYQLTQVATGCFELVVQLKSGGTQQDGQHAADYISSMMGEDVELTYLIGHFDPAAKFVRFRSDL